MAKWIRCQLNGGKIDEKRRLFNAKSSQRMWSSHTIIPLSDSSREHYPSTHFRSYGLGWSLADYKGRKTVGHSGGYDGMYSRVLLVPEEKLGIVVLTNSMTSISTALTHRIMDSYLGGEQKDWSQQGLKRYKEGRKTFFARIKKATTPRPEATSPSHSLDAYASTYSSKLYGNVKVSIEADQLVLQLLPAKKLIADLKHLHFDTFVLRWRNESAWFGDGTAQFLMNAAGRVVELKLDVPNDDLWFYELELKR